MAHDGVLRSRLKESQPELHECLLRSWKIAQDEWLPMIGAHLGSSNSYPHLRNVESHLDQIVAAFQEHSAASFHQPLGGLELYLLLASVLFHDIGRTQKTQHSHGKASQEYLNKGFAHLGIPSRELALVIGKICVCHCPPEGKGRRQALRELSTTTIEPFGRAREELLAALLTLADCMDAAYTRALPRYLADPDEIGPVGLFRRSISGVYVDPVARLVRTVLGPDDAEARTGPKDGAAPRDEARYGLELNYADDGATNRRKAEWDELLGDSANVEVFKAVLGASVKTGRASPKWHSIAGAEKLLQERLQGFLNRNGSPELSPGPKRLLELYAGGSERNWLLGKVPKDSCLLHGLLSLDLLRLVPIDDPNALEKKKVHVPLPPKAPLAIILGDMRNNRHALEEVQDTLASSGLLLDDWVIERDDRLYNQWGNPTYEPLFHTEYLVQVARAMWDLSRQIFAACRFSYQELASCVGDHDVERVRLAVRRIAVTTDGLPFEGAASSGDGGPVETGAVHAGSTYWEWRVLGYANRRQYVPLDRVERAIRNDIEAPHSSR